MAEIVEIQQEVEFFGMDRYDPTCYAIEILNAKYEKIQIDDVVNQLKHLNVQQQAGIKRHKTNKLIYRIKILLRNSYWISDAFFNFCNCFRFFETV